MKQTSGPAKQPADAVVKDIRRATRRQFSAEEKIRIVLEGLRGEESIAELCRREGIASSMYYGWSKEFLEAGKKRLAGDTARAVAPDWRGPVRALVPMERLELPQTARGFQVQRSVARPRHLCIEPTLKPGSRLQRCVLENLRSLSRFELARL